MSEEGAKAIAHAADPGAAHAMIEPTMEPEPDNGMARIENPDMVPRSLLDAAEVEIAALRAELERLKGGAA